MLLNHQTVSSSTTNTLGCGASGLIRLASAAHRLLGVDQLGFQLLDQTTDQFEIQAGTTNAAFDESVRCACVDQ